MVFNSNIFLFIFLPSVLLISMMLIKKVKLSNIFLILASLFFYTGVSISNLILLIFVAIVNYLIGYFLEKNRNKVILTIGIIFNISFLFYYKYLGFSIGLLNDIFALNIVFTQIVIPLGVSFFIFSAISYLMDIYRQDAKNGSFFDFLLYISFFPKVISGPIVRFKDFKGQITDRKINSDLFVLGIERFIIGLAKKVIIADVLGGVADNIFNSLSLGMDVPTAWLGAICYTLQIYYDFAGYSSMAIGISNMLGFDFMENFNFPYISKSATEFWRRWHISLGAWFRNYLYFPLGGNRRGNVYFNLFIVFIATGIWHGANWTFIFWGIGYGIVLIIERYIMKKDFYQKIPSWVKWFITINIVNISWVAFKSPDMGSAFRYLSMMFGAGAGGQYQFTFAHYFTTKIMIIMLIGCVGATVLSNKRVQTFWNQTMNESALLYSVKIISLILLFYMGVMFMINSTYSPFIYFQF